MKDLVLASASPRRCALLEQMGAVFSVCPAEVDETIDPQLGGAEYWAVSLAEKKARAAARMSPASQAVILAADTMVVIDGKILGKPKSDEDALEKLRLLSGRCHEVITGFCLLDSGSGKTCTDCVKTSVFFRKLSETEMQAYVACGEGKDKAGGYGIQGLGAMLVERIEGCYFNVVGLPISAVYRGLQQMGIELLGEKQDVQ